MWDVYIKHFRKLGLNRRSLLFTKRIFDKSPSLCCAYKLFGFQPNLLKSTLSTSNPKVYEELSAIQNLLKRSLVVNQRRYEELRNLYCLQSNRNYSTPSRNPGDSNNNQNNDNNEDDNDDKKRLFAKATLWMLIAYALLGFVSLIFSDNKELENSQYVSWNEFVHQMLSKGEVEEITIRPDVNIATIMLHEGSVIKGRKVDNRIYYMSIMNVGQFESKLRETEASLGIGPEHSVQVIYDRSSDSFGRQLFILFVIGAIIALVVRSGNFKLSMPNQLPFQMSRAKFTIIDPLLPGSGKGVKFSDVAGAKEAKQEVMEFVDFLKNPSIYQKLGAKVPKGALLLGPPGCGKTLLAKAVATEGQVPFLAMNGSEFVEMIGGLGAARVRDLFKEAKKRAPCIIYIDELDAIGRKRSSGASLDGGSQESEQTLNQLLVEMDGILSKEGVVLLASTNRFDILDKALLRPGRFDRHIVMELPTQDERRQIFDHHLKSIILEKPASFYSKRMATLTLGFSGADIANVVNEAALFAARHDKKSVSAADLEYAVERVVGGTEKRSQSLSPEEKRVVAFHEAGHAIVGWLLEHTDALLKVTIVPRTNLALGFAQYTPKEQKLYTQQEIFQKMCMALGGRVAESLTFNRVTTGAQNDLEKVTKMAYAQVRTFGFSEAVGQVSFPEEETRQEGRRPYSQRLASIIDDEVSKMVFSAYKATEELLNQNGDKLKLLAESLLQKETLNYEDVEALLGPPPYGPKGSVEPIQFENEINSWNQSEDDSPKSS